MRRLSLHFGNCRGTGKGIAQRRLSSFWRAVQCGFALEWGRFSGLAARALKFCADGTYEKALLDGLVPLARNERGDLRRATGIFERLQRSFEKHELKETHRSACEEGYVFRLYVLTLYARASCYYYGERDADALKTFQDCLSVLDRRHWRSVSGIVRRGDVQRKIDSLEFNQKGYERAMRLVQRGDFGLAVRQLDLAIARIGLDYLDNEVVCLAAKAHFEVGDVSRGLASLKKAAESNAELAWTVGSAYHEGSLEMTGKRGASKWVRVRRNARLAEVWLRRAVEGGCTGAMLDLASLLGESGRMEEALALETRAWRKGEVFAAINAAITCSALGREKLCHAWLLRGMRKCRTDTALLMAKTLLVGYGVCRNLPQAKRLLEEVAANRSAFADERAEARKLLQQLKRGMLPTYIGGSIAEKLK